MLDKILDFIADKLAKSPSYKPAKSVNITPTKGTKWTATEDGMMIIRMSPTQSGISCYCYINYEHPNAPETAGGYGIVYVISTAGNQVTQCVPMVKGATYSIFDMANVDKVTFLTFPFEKIGGH